MTTDLDRTACRVLLDHFTAAELRELASFKDSQTPGMVARRRLTDEALDELAEMLAAGRKPTIGWWRRHG